MSASGGGDGDHDLEPIALEPEESDAPAIAHQRAPVRVRFAATWALTAGLVMAVALGGFTGPASPRPTGLLARALADTARAGSARVTITMTFSGAGTAEEQRSQTTSMDGVIGFLPARGTLHVHTPVAAFGGGGSGDSTVVLTGRTLYTQVDALGALHVFGGRHWLKRDLADGDAVAGPFGLATVGGRNTSVPHGLLAPSPALERLGRETVGGTETVRYRARLAMPASHQPVAVELWIDGHDRVRRFRESVGGASGLGDAVDFTVEYSDFGAHVAADPPPANDVVDGDRFGRPTPTIPEDA